MKHYKLFALLPAFALLFTLAACKPSADAPTDGPSEEVTATVPPTEEPSDEPVITPDCMEPHVPVQVAVLSGPTGVGAAKLLDGIDNDPASLRTSYAPVPTAQASPVSS